MDRGNVSLRDDLDLATAPKYPLRGHQLGYRPKCNSYDAWDLPTWEQYFRDLAVFGCNAIELIPPRSDDDADSPHFPRPPMEMMQGMSRLADAYGLDVWIWYPAMDKDYANAQTVESALREKVPICLRGRGEASRNRDTERGQARDHFADRRILAPDELDVRVLQPLEGNDVGIHSALLVGRRVK